MGVCVTILEVLDAVREMYGLTREDLSIKVQNLQRKYPEPGERMMDAKELNRIFEARSLPRARTLGLIKKALKLPCEPLDTLFGGEHE